MSLDVDAIRSRQAVRRGGGVAADGPTPEEDVDTLLTAVTNAQRDVQRCEDLMEDLRASSELWARLYHANVSRANTAEAERDRLRSSPPQAPKPRN
jgi:hypothetical protein